jgi:GLPGLI family protein
MHYRAFYKVSCFLVFAIVLGYGCGNKKAGNGISEGVIEYDAEPVDKAHPMADLAPSKMTVKFKDNKSCVDLSAGMGLFSTSFISDPETHTMIQLVKLLNKKYVHIFDTIELKKENAVGPRMVIEKTNETKMIATYKCKKAIIKFPGNEHSSFDVYYTNDISIETPNWSNPFSELDGVLMEYQISQHGLEMHFLAKSVTSSDVDDATFDELFSAFQ